MDEKPFDFEAALTTALGNGDLLQRLMSRYFIQATQALKSMTVALESGDLRILGDVGHRMKGSSGMIHALELQAVFRSIEEAALGGDPVRAQRRLGRLRLALERFREALEQRGIELPESAGPVPRRL